MSKNKYPAPWNLNGNGYMFLYKFKKDFIKNCSFISEDMKKLYVGGLGCMMIVNYKQSNCGPYGELLFIPGKFRCSEGKKNSITKIYVSSIDSVENGRINWGIPKENSDFEFEKTNNKIIQIKLSKDNKPFFNVKIKKYGPSFPVTTKLLPFPLAQFLNEQSFFTDFSGKGTGRLCKLSDLAIDRSGFEELDKVKPLIGIAVDNFNITFPKAIIKEGNTFNI